MARPDYRSVDEYIAAQPRHVRPVLERVRETLRKALPSASEAISYQIPVYKIGGAMVLYFAGYQHHYSIYPATVGLLDALGDELDGVLKHKATLRFSLEEPVPTRLITRIAKLRAAEAGRPVQTKAPSKARARAATRPAKKSKPRSTAAGRTAKKSEPRRGRAQRKPSL